MPKLWSETIATHRHEVGDAIVEATVSLVAEIGLRAVTMAGIAERTGVGRATLYRYFPDVEAILMAWHERHVAAHLAHLEEVGHGAGGRLEAVLGAYALMRHAVAGRNHGADLVALVHGVSVDDAQRRLVAFLSDLLAQAVAAGAVRHDVAVEELAAYCLSALSGAARVGSQAAVGRLVEVTMAGLRPVSGAAELLGPVGGGDDGVHHRGAHGA